MRNEIEDVLLTVLLYLSFYGFFYFGYRIFFTGGTMFDYFGILLAIILLFFHFIVKD